MLCCGSFVWCVLYCLLMFACADCVWMCVCVCVCSVLCLFVVWCFGEFAIVLSRGVVWCVVSCFLFVALVLLL